MRAVRDKGGNGQHRGEKAGWASSLLVALVLRASGSQRQKIYIKVGPNGTDHFHAIINVYNYISSNKSK